MSLSSTGCPVTYWFVFQLYNCLCWLNHQHACLSLLLVTIEVIRQLPKTAKPGFSSMFRSFRVLRKYSIETPHTSVYLNEDECRIDLTWGYHKADLTPFVFPWCVVFTFYFFWLKSFCGLINVFLSNIYLQITAETLPSLQFHVFFIKLTFTWWPLNYLAYNLWCDRHHFIFTCYYFIYYV